MPAKKIRRAVLGLTAAAAAVGGTIALSDTASADTDTPWCVTRYEFNRVQRGMTYERVTRIFGRKAWVGFASVYGGGLWDYRACGSDGSDGFYDGWVIFKGDRVTKKVPYWDWD